MDVMEEAMKEVEVVDKEVVDEVVQRFSRVSEGEEMAVNNTSDSGCNVGEGGDLEHLNGLTTELGYVEKLTTNNAYSAVTSSKKLSTNEKPESTSSYTSSVSTNGKAGGGITKKVGGRNYPVRLPGNLGR